jgi:hypothetical protein
VSKKTELYSECLCFDEFPEQRFELAVKLQTEKLPCDSQDSEYLFVAGFQFREEFPFLQLKSNLLIGGQDRAYSFLNARNRQMLHNVYKGSFIVKYLLRQPFTVDLPS